MKESDNLAYIVGVAFGDGNLSNPNGRATRLRITCDSSYPVLAEEIRIVLRKLFPNNKVTDCLSNKDSYFNISVYSNSLDKHMPAMESRTWIKTKTECTRTKLDFK